MEGVEGGGPTALIPLDSVDLVVGKVMVLLGAVVPFQDHRQKAGGREGRQLSSQKPEMMASVLTSTWTGESFERGVCFLTSGVQLDPGFGWFLAEKDGVRDVSFHSLRANALTTYR